MSMSDSFILFIIHVVFCRAYDRAAIKFRGLDADINFHLNDYQDEIKHVSTSYCNLHTNYITNVKPILLIS